MKLIKTLKDNFFLFENVAQAEKIMREIDLPLDNPKYLEFKKILAKNNNINYIGILMSLSKQKMSPNNENKEEIIDDSNQLYNLILDNKQYLNYLPNKINDYKNYETLLYDLSNLKDKSLLNKFARLMTNKDIKKDIINSHSSILNNNIIYYFDNLEGTKFASVFKKKISKYKTVGQISNYLSLVVKFHKEGFEYDKWLEKIKSNPKHFKIVYNDEKTERILIITKSWNALRSIGSPSWCIYNNYDSYIDYTNQETYTQYVFLDFSTDDLNYSIIGFTMNTDGEITASHLMNDEALDNAKRYFNQIGVTIKFKKINTDYLKVKEIKESFKNIEAKNYQQESDYQNNYADEYPHDSKTNVHYRSLAKLKLILGEYYFDENSYSGDKAYVVYKRDASNQIVKNLNEIQSTEIIAAYLLAYLNNFQNLRMFLDYRGELTDINVFHEKIFENLNTSQVFVDALIKIFIRYKDFKRDTYLAFINYFRKVFKDEKVLFNIIRQRKTINSLPYSDYEFFNLKDAENMKAKILNKIQKSRREGYVDLTIQEVKEGIKLGLGGTLKKLYLPLIPYFMENPVDYDSMLIFKELGFTQYLVDAIKYKADNFGKTSLNSIEYSMLEYNNKAFKQ